MTTEMDAIMTEVFPEPLSAYAVAPSDASIQVKFEEFHRLNPWVYEHLVRLARQLVQRGHDKVGIKMLWEVLRWQTMFTHDPNSEFKLSNNYHSRYARLIMDQEVDLVGVFETRGLRSA